MNVVKSNLLGAVWRKIVLILTNGKKQQKCFYKEIRVKQNRFGNCPDEYEQIKYGRRYMYLFHGCLRYFKEIKGKGYRWEMSDVVTHVDKAFN